MEFMLLAQAGVLPLLQPKSNGWYFTFCWCFVPGVVSELVWHHSTVWAAKEAPTYLSVAAVLRRRSVGKGEVALSWGDIERWWKGES